MNRWEIVFSGALALTLSSVFLLVERGECSNIRQRSDGCGPHPLIALAAASRPFGSNGVGSLNDVLRAVRADPVVWPVMQNLLRRYDDCIRAADGLHYKRSGDSTAATAISSSSSGGAVRSKNTLLRGEQEGGGGGFVRASGSGRSIFVGGSESGSFPIAFADPEDITTGTNVIIPWLHPSSN